MTAAASDTSLTWLGKRLPRYTSYPTAPHFKPLAAQTYGRWLVDIAPPKRASLYVHIPFCRALCWFCGCHTQVTNNYHRVEAYLEALEREIELVGQHLANGIGIKFLHFGGGSPTILKPDDFERLMAALRQAFTFERAAEIAIEIDPRTVGADRIGRTWGEPGGARSWRRRQGNHACDRITALALYPLPRARGGGRLIWH